MSIIATLLLVYFLGALLTFGFLLWFVDDFKIKSIKNNLRASLFISICWFICIPLLTCIYVAATKQGEMAYDEID